jgi:hypothetical protein
MKLLIVMGMIVAGAWAQVKPETFVVQINDRSLSVNAPEKKKNTFTVVVENRSLSDQLGRFIVQGKLLKYVSVKSGLTESVEIENKSASNVFFVPVSPAFQEAELIFGKKAYEIPSKE